ncbi:tyrosine-type recombinase/integrase [Priestia sp. JV24]|uniref:tyrosine-type recombinase/integrase n=1 Tax=Priestia TaxID=2800373 RepID=UPI0021D678A7|nr:tyrosine-type recombinase/integrase [Priestia megaterium]MCW1043810.1 tyrosine-type recombinase/integrase [Priestia sp. JV24]
MSRRSNELTTEEMRALAGVLPASNFTLEELIDIFIDDCTVRNLREHSIRFYRNELSTFMRSIQAQGVEVNAETITAEVIKRNVILHMKEQGIKPVSINTRLRAIRAFFNFLYKQRYIKHNPMNQIELLRHRKEVIETLTVAQINKLLNACNLRTFIGVRDYTIIMLLVETGVRANELIGINVEDINFSNGLIRIRNAKSYRERLVPIQSKMKDQLRKYLNIRGEAITDALFVTLDGTSISKRQVQSRITGCARKAKITDVRVSCHTLRHTFAKLCVMNGANAFQLQAILGHTTLDMTKVYVNLFSNEVAEGHKQFSPLKNINNFRF